MKRSHTIVMALGAFLILCSWWIYRAVFSNEELASKVEWSVIQSAAWRYRDKPIDKLEIVKVDEYFVLGIPVPDARKAVWIMLNARNPPYYKQGPIGDYRLLKDDLKKVLGSGIVSSTVANCLESHVQDVK